MTIVQCLLAVLLAAGTVSAAPSEVPSVGVESALSIELPVAGLRPRPAHPRDAILLRLEEATAQSDGTTRYQFRFSGFVPGEHDLADYLVESDGRPAKELPPIPVTVRSMLPADYDGMLEELQPTPVDRLGGYSRLFTVAWLAWLALLIPLLRAGRQQETVSASPSAALPPTLAERLRPLVEAAAANRLDTAGKQRLEALLLRQWREELRLDGLSMAESVGRLRGHAAAGPLLAAVEGWLHRPGGVRPDDIRAVLRPFEALPAASDEEPR